MTRPPFLTRPLDWMRTARTGQDRVDYACSVSGQCNNFWHRLAVLFVVSLAVGNLIGFLAWWARQ